MQIRLLSPGILFINALAVSVKTVACQKFLLKYFRKQLKIRETEDSRKFSALQ